MGDTITLAHIVSKSTICKVARVSLAAWTMGAGGLREIVTTEANRPLEATPHDDQEGTAG